MSDKIQTGRLAGRSFRLTALDLMSRSGVYIMIALLLIVGTIVAPDIFLTFGNLIDILEVGALLGTVALGVTFVTYSGNFLDLSVPSIMAFSGIMAVQLLPLGLAASIAGALLTGCLIGAINGYMVRRLKANPIIWTLAVQFLVSGLLKWAYTGNQIYPDAVAGGNMRVVESFYAIYRTRLFGVIPLIVVIMLALALLCQVVLSRTRYGQQLRTDRVQHQGRPVLGHQHGADGVGRIHHLRRALPASGGCCSPPCPSSGPSTWGRATISARSRRSCWAGSRCWAAGATSWGSSAA